MKTRGFPLFSVILLALALLLSACDWDNPDIKDGYYAAEAKDFDDYGWKEYVTIYVSDGQIITVEYDSFNASGFLKSWDMNYTRGMKAVSGTYPNEYARAYAISLLNWQSPDTVDAVSGATDSHVVFQLLAEAAVSKAKAGDKSVALVELD